MSRARSGSVAASVPGDGGERVGLLVVVGDGLGGAFGVGDEPGAVRVGGWQCPRDGGERTGLPVVVGDGLGGAFGVGDEPGAVRVGGWQCPGDGGERTGLPVVVGNGLGDAFGVYQVSIAVRSDVMGVDEGCSVRCGRGRASGSGIRCRG
jgi:hypothetical protein